VKKSRPLLLIKVLKIIESLKVDIDENAFGVVYESGMFFQTPVFS
jgi:hypothetical protein